MKGRRCCPTCGGYVNEEGVSTAAIRYREHAEKLRGRPMPAKQKRKIRKTLEARWEKIWAAQEGERNG